MSYILNDNNAFNRNPNTPSNFELETDTKLDLRFEVSTIEPIDPDEQINLLTVGKEKLEELYTRTSGIGQTGFLALQNNCPNLKTLVHFNATNTDDNALTIISKFKKLETLTLAGSTGRLNTITDFGMRDIIDNCSKLRNLDVSGCDITDKTLRLVSRSNIHSLRIFNCTKVTNGEIQNLRQSRPQLVIITDKTNDPYEEYLRLFSFHRRQYEPSHAHSPIRAPILPANPDLETETKLDLRQELFAGINHDEYISLVTVGKERVEEFYMKFSRITENGFQNLLENCPRLKTLVLTQAFVLNDQILKVISSFKELETINFEHSLTQLSEEGAIFFINNCQKLVNLNLSGLGLSQKILETIFSRTNIKHLTLNQCTNITLEDIEKLKESRQDLRIETDLSDTTRLVRSSSNYEMTSPQSDVIGPHHSSSPLEHAVKLVKRLTDENEELKNTISQKGHIIKQQSEEILSLQKVLANHSIENEDLKAKNEILISENLKLKSENLPTLQPNSNENEKLNRQIANLVSQHDSDRKMIEEQQLEIARLKRQFFDSQREVSTLKLQVKYDKTNIKKD